MQITQETDYAVRLVDVLARSGVHMEAGVLSEQAHVPLRFSAKILRSLVKSGIVCSRKGAHGGYRLARPAGDITLLEVLEAVEGPYRICRCQGENYQCSHTACRFSVIYEEITGIVREKLALYTFAVSDQNRDT